MMMSWIRLPSPLSWLHGIRISSVNDILAFQNLAYFMDQLFSFFPMNERCNCLPRSLVLYEFAKRSGFPLRLYCGVRWVEHELTGHEWLSLQGKAFFDPSHQWEHFEMTHFSPESSEQDALAKDQCDK